MLKGSCLCGAVQYTLLSEPKKVSHCYCTMCQKQHGAAFATYASLPKEDLVYKAGEDCLASYHSSESIVRKFCKHCGSNIEWTGSKEYPDWTSVTMATLDTPYKPKQIVDIYTDSRCCWLETKTST